MKKLILSLMLLTGPLWGATTYTTNSGIPKPADGDTGWGTTIRAAYDVIDSSFAILPVNLATDVEGTLPATNMVSTAVFTNKQNVFTDTNNFQAVSASSLSVNGNLNISGLTANQCVQTTTNGLLTTSGASCGGSGGASALGVNQNGVSVTTPTFALNGLSPPFLITSIGAGATAQWALDGSSVTMKGTNVIGLQSTLQSASTFYVSSGTVNGTLTANKVVVSTLSVTGNSSLDALRVTGSSGLTVDSLPANQCLQADSTGKITAISAACNVGNGGASTLEVMGNSVRISSPTPTFSLIAGSNITLSTALVAGATAQITIASTAGGIVSPGTFTWTNTKGLTISTLAVTGDSIILGGGSLVDIGAMTINGNGSQADLLHLNGGGSSVPLINLLAASSSKGKFGLGYDGSSYYYRWKSADINQADIMQLNTTGTNVGKLTLTYGLVVGTITFSSNSSGGIQGTTTNDSAPTGYVGEYVESVVGVTNFPTSTQWGDMTSISLTAGDWDVTYQQMNELSTGVGYTTVGMGISVTSGNSTTGLVKGSNELVSVYPGTAVNDAGGTIANYRVSIAGTTTYYAKMMGTYSSGQPRCQGRLSARRIR